MNDLPPDPEGAAEAHVPHLGHHYASLRQQQDAGKLGMWLFLATEVLLFGGLFCAYANYRANHPEIFVFAHQFLDKTLGGINTVVLICSSLTMAWAVRAAQLGNRRLLARLLLATLLLAFCFLGIKGIEYRTKWEHGLLWGKRYRPTAEALAEVRGGPAAAPTPAAPAAGPGKSAAQAAPAAPAAKPVNPDATTVPPPARAPSGLATAQPGAAEAAAASAIPHNVQIFFGIYFLMTGLHAIHVIAGMIVITWLLRRTLKGEFGDGYYTPVDLGGLYWHLVDMIWIYLFPLLYLIR